MAPHVIHGARWGIPLGKAPMADLLWAALFVVSLAPPAHAYIDPGTGGPGRIIGMTTYMKNLNSVAFARTQEEKKSPPEE